MCFIRCRVGNLESFYLQARGSHENKSSFVEKEKGNAKKKYPQVKSGLDDSMCANKKIHRKKKKGMLFLSIRFFSLRNLL